MNLSPLLPINDRDIPQRLRRMGEAMIAFWKSPSPANSLQERLVLLEQSAYLYRLLQTYLSPLKGSLRQIEWAFAIRQRLLKQVIKRFKEIPEEKDLQALAHRITITFSQTNAARWIELRQHHLTLIIKE